MGKDCNGKELGKGIRQTKSGRYEARYIDRFGKRKSIYGTSKIEVRNKLQTVLKENAEKGTVKRRMTVRQWYKEWMNVYKLPVIRPNTRRHYEHIFDTLILPEMGNMYVDEVRQIHVKNLINLLDAKGYLWETQNKVRILILDLFNIAIENDFALKNPSKGIRLAKNKPNDRIVLSVEEQEDFLRCAAGTFYENLFLTAINTGLRPGEICALEEADLDFGNHVISVRKTLLYQKLNGDEGKEFHIGPPKTESSIRTVPMNEVCEDALKKQMRLKQILSKKYVQTGEFQNLLFVTKFNTPICSVVLNDAIKRIVNEINLQRDEIELFPAFSAHTFRHTFATRCIEAGILPKTVQK
ncbi:MAG: site-specific integrase, partial [Lachnospiraceae bacterium]|nr:site-specific integrase [Lachnospiraceae bacterium]